MAALTLIVRHQMQSKYATKNETFTLGWLDPRDNRVNYAGVSFYKPTYGEYLLKIDEESNEKRYFLKPSISENNRITYRMELVLKRKDGSFRKRQLVGSGYSNAETNGNVFVNYGSKFKTLVLYLKSKRSETMLKRSLQECESCVQICEVKGA